MVSRGQDIQVKLSLYVVGILLGVTLRGVTLPGVLDPGLDTSPLTGVLDP